MVIIFIPLKFLQTEQNFLINLISSRKAIALISKNNQKTVQKSIENQNYIHVFTNPEIALSKKFKANVLDYLRFSQCFSLSAVDKIYLVEEYGNIFQHIYN